jgi:hypothetical protein
MNVNENVPKGYDNCYWIQSRSDVFTKDGICFCFFIIFLGWLRGEIIFKFLSLNEV